MPYKDPEKTKEYAKKYRKNNKEKINEYRQSEKGKRSCRISEWKYSGLVSDVTIL